MCHPITSDGGSDLFHAEFHADFRSGLHFDLKDCISEHILNLSWGLHHQPFGFLGFWRKKMSCFLTYFQFNNQANEFMGFNIFCRLCSLSNLHHFLQNLEILTKLLFFWWNVCFYRSADAVIWFRQRIRKWPDPNFRDFFFQWNEKRFIVSSKFMSYSSENTSNCNNF